MVTSLDVLLPKKAEIVLSIMPDILGDGTLFFDFVGKELNLHLTDSTAFKDDMIDLTYKIIEDQSGGFVRIWSFQCTR